MWLWWHVTSEAPVCVERVDAAAVYDALDPDVRVDTVEGVRHQVAVGLGAECPGGEAHEHELLGLGQPGVLQQVRQYRHHDVPPVEGEALRLLAGRPRPGVDVAAAVRHVGWQNIEPLELSRGNGQVSDVTGSADVTGRYLAKAIISDKSKWRK